MIEQQQLPPVLAKVWDWVQSRVDAESMVQAALHVVIPRGVRTYFLGGMTLFFFGVQVITGILLVLYYRPSPEDAYQSVLFIMNEVRFGWLIRSVHAWSANLMIVTCVLHLLRVYFQGAYKKPREMTWMAGVVLLLITFSFGLTGYLLPWDQRAFWATTVTTEIAGAMPLIGDFARSFMRSGGDVSGLTLTRFFGIHVLILPLSLALFLLIHLVLIHEQGLAPPPGTDDEEARA